ncbi:HAD family hydrolase [Proteinivorax hydrogeniformans]|uniref:HAD family hydrolase n=1 Tax=Proteinivorax hydrogeniformans TaxID=1826727 RepID=A0AAU8HUB6_9FIRM
MIKLVAIDLDGTLLNDSGEIHPKDSEKIQKLISNGVYVVLATGRTFKSAQYIAKQLNLNVPIITYNGGLIKDTISQRVIHCSKINLDTAKEILKLAEHQQVYARAYVDDVLWEQKENTDAKHYAKKHRISYKIKGKLSQTLDKDPYILLFKDRENPSKIYNLTNKLKELNKVTVTSSTPDSVEVMSKETSKAHALKIICKKLNIPKEKTLAIGNSLNDYDMLSWAGTGVAMQNSDQALLKIWDKVSKHTNNQAGVSRIIEEFINF